MERENEYQHITAAVLAQLIEANLRMRPLHSESAEYRFVDHIHDARLNATGDGVTVDMANGARYLITITEKRPGDTRRACLACGHVLPVGGLCANPACPVNRGNSAADDVLQDGAPDAGLHLSFEIDGPEALVEDEDRPRSQYSVFGRRSDQPQASEGMKFGVSVTPLRQFVEQMQDVLAIVEDPDGRAVSSNEVERHVQAWRNWQEQIDTNERELLAAQYAGAFETPKQTLARAEAARTQNGE